MSKPHRPKQTGRQQATETPLCAGNCGRQATTVIFDVTTRNMRPALAMILCDECNTRRKQIEATPYDESSDDDKAFILQIAKPRQGQHSSNR